MSEIGDYIYESMKKYKYVFVVLGASLNALDAIKEIMFESKIDANDGEITFYAPYKELFEAHGALYGAGKMWGIGFKLSALKDKANWIGGQMKPEYQNDKGLSSCKVKVETLDFTEFDRNSDEVFFVVPSLNDWKKVWYMGRKPGTDFELWWCQGLHKGCCSVTRNDADIEKYLGRKKAPFQWKNYYKDVTNEKLFGQSDLLAGVGDFKIRYSLLNIMAQEINNGCVKVVDVTGQTLF